MSKLIILFTLISSSVFSQSLKTDSNRLLYVQEIVEVSNLTASDLYFNAKIFAANNFKDYKSVVQLEDSSRKIIFIKGNLPLEIENENKKITNPGYISFKLTIECREKKYRYTINEFYHVFFYRDMDLSAGRIENDKPDGPLDEVVFDLIKKKLPTLLIDFQKVLIKTMQQKQNDW